MKKQSTDVDVVSGATYSSNGLINAVKNALKEAEKVTNGQTTEPDKEEADTSELEKAMKEAEELKQEDYTEATYAVLKTRMEDAQKLLDADKTEISQEDVDQALENLNQALTLLEKKMMAKMILQYIKMVSMKDVRCADRMKMKISRLII